MASFLVHVVLHHAKLWGDYDTLHDAMKDAGFDKTVVANDGNEYRLPPAEYAYSGDVTIKAVRRLAKQAAKTTGHTFSLFVAGWTGRWAGLNLEPVEDGEDDDE